MPNKEESTAGAAWRAAERLVGNEAVDAAIADMPADEANKANRGRDIGRRMSSGAVARALANMPKKGTK